MMPYESYHFPKNKAVEEVRIASVKYQILAIFFTYLTWYFFYFMVSPQEKTLRVLPLVFSFGLLVCLVLFLLQRHYRFTVILWLAGLVLLLFGHIHIFSIAEIALFLTILPFLATVNLGLLAGGLTLPILAGLILFWQPQAISITLSPLYVEIIFLGGLLIAILGWMANYPFHQTTAWSVLNFEKARRDLEEARDERLEFRQLQEDLILANRELARLSDRLKKLNQVAEEAVRVKEEFVANVSHELRTPLNMIIGFCEMITQSPGVYGRKLPDLLLADITAIQRNSEHLSQLVNDVLDLSQIDAGRMALSKQWVFLQDIIQEAVEAIQDFYESKCLYLKVHLPEEPIQLLCDRTRIREVILNLLSNAGRFTDQGGVEIRAWVEGDDVVVSLADTGPGISIQDQKRLFEPFQQLDGSIRRKFGGSGLGLHISCQFVEMHNGKMWLESTPGQGSTFYFRLPVVQPFEPSSSASHPASRWINPYQAYEGRTRKFKASTPTLTPRYILYEQGETLERLLKRYADTIEVERVFHLEQAVESTKKVPAQAVIVNSSSGPTNPSELSSFAAELPYGIPILYCWVQGSDRVAQDLGVERYLVKPVQRETLLQALRTLPNPPRIVLLVDDHPEILQLFGRILASDTQQYHLLRANNGQQALRLLRERKPDVMLLDLVLEGMDGFEVLRAKNNDPDIRDIPVIIISSLDPTGSPIISDALTITHKGGLSARELLTCIQAVSQALSPLGRVSDPESIPLFPD